MKGLQYGLLATSLALSIALAEQGSPAQSQGVSTQSQSASAQSQGRVKLQSTSVVTAGGFEQEHTLAPASISVVTPEDIASRPARDLAEALSNVPGVSIDTGVTKTGGYGISIRGMGTAYTLILVDGKRINADNSLFPNGFGDSVTSFMPPLSAIERIEVIRGPASTLYGSDAIGGVVNIITKKSFEKWGTSFGYDYTFQESKPFGNTQGFNFYTAGPLNEAKNWGLSLRGRQYTRDGVSTSDLAVAPNHTGTGTNHLTAGGVVGSAPGRIYNLGGRLIWNSLDTLESKPKNSVYLDVDYSQQSYDNSDGLVMSNRRQWDQNRDKPDQEFQSVYGYSRKYNIYRGNVVLAHNGHYISSPTGILSNLSTDTSITYNITSNAGRNVPGSTFGNGSNGGGGGGGGGGGNSGSNNNGFLNGVRAGDNRELISQDLILDHKTNLFFTFSDNFGLNTTIGARYWYNNFHDKLLQVTRGNATADQHIGALFGEGEFIFFERLFLTLGARGNFNSIFGSNLSPRAYLAYNAIDKWLTLKGGVSTGYKSPSLNNLVPEIVSFSGSGANPTYGNPNLRPESSINYELSAISDNEYFNLSLTGFYIDFKDKINQVGGLAGQITNGMIIPVVGVQCQATSGACSYYDNEDKAVSYGAEVFLGIKPISVGYGAISLSTAYTYNKTKVIEGSNVGARFTNVPLHSLNASLNYDTHTFGAYVRQEWKAGIYRGDPSVPNSAAAAAGEFYDPYYLTHLGGYYKFTDSLRLNLAVYNLFNFNFIDYTSYAANIDNIQYTNAFNYVREGRRYYVSLMMDF